MFIIVNRKILLLLFVNVRHISPITTSANVIMCEIFIFSDYKYTKFFFSSCSCFNKQNKNRKFSSHFSFVMRPQATIFCVFHGHQFFSILKIPMTKMLFFIYWPHFLSRFLCLQSFF